MTHEIETPRNCINEEKTATIQGDQYKIELDHEKGLIDIRHRGALVHFHSDLTMYDFFLRFYPDLPEAYQQFSRELIQKHLDSYKGHVRLHRFNGDDQRFRISAEDTRYLFEDWCLDHDLEIDTVARDHDMETDEIEENFHMELVYGFDSHEIINEALEKFEEAMHETLEEYGLEDMIEEFPMIEFHRKYREVKGLKLSEAMNNVDPEDIIEGWE